MGENTHLEDTSEYLRGSEDEDDLQSFVTVKSFLSQLETTETLNLRMQPGPDEHLETHLNSGNIESAGMPYMCSTASSRAKARKARDRELKHSTTIEVALSGSFSDSTASVLDLTFDSDSTMSVSEGLVSDHLSLINNNGFEREQANEDLLVLGDDISEACTAALNALAVVSSCCQKNNGDTLEVTVMADVSSDETVTSTTICNVEWRMLRLMKLVSVICLGLLVLDSLRTRILPYPIGAAVIDVDYNITEEPLVEETRFVVPSEEPRSVLAVSILDDIVELSMVLAAC